MALAWATSSVAVAPALAAEAAAIPFAEAAPVEADDEVTLDGRLDEAVWQSTSPVGGFRQRDPIEGAAATFPTEFRVAYDEVSLYVAVVAFDPEPSRIVGHVTRRDSGSPSDWIRVLVDSWNDRRTAFEFAVNPAGVRQDRYWFNDHDNDSGWDAVWDVAVARGAHGWSAEFRIPLSQLRFAAATDAQFGFAVVRDVARLNETSSWPLLPRSAQGYVSSFGRLAGLTVGRAAKRFEIVPYAVGEYEALPPDDGNPLATRQDADAVFGVDFKYAVTPGIRLTGTVNPDFGQVEADPAVVNLSAFETYFGERRPFFLEGSGIFRFDLDLFYSRRIGRSPRGEPEVPDGGASTQPAVSTILGAAKVTGRLGSYSFGALSAVTSDERATVAAPDGTRTRPLVEPSTAYTVFRGRREWPNQSSVGVMLTATNRRVTGVLDDLLPTHAYAGGLDANWQLSPQYRLSAYVASSHVAGDAAAIETLQTDARHYFQRPDSAALSLDPTRTSLSGHASRVEVEKVAGERLRFSSSLSLKTPGFDVNELGFLRRADERRANTWVQWRRDRPWRIIRNARFTTNQWLAWNADGDRISAGGNVSANAEFTNNWSASLGVGREVRTLDDRLTRGGPGGYQEPRTNVWGHLDTDDRRTMSGGVYLSRSEDEAGNGAWEISPRLTLRPSAALSMSVNLLLAGNRDHEQWIDELEGVRRPHYVFGDLDQETTAVAVRLNYAVSPTLTLQLYGRPFVTAGDYLRYKELVDGRAPANEDRFAPFDYGEDADFRFRSFRMTNVMRWEYRPGSTLFLVWQQGREREDPWAAHGRDLGSPFSAPTHNVFLVLLA
jgi:hypothetical protein